MSRNATLACKILTSFFLKFSAFETDDRVLETKKADLITFGRPFISNPDLVEKLKISAELTDPDRSTFYAVEIKVIPTIK